MDCNNILMQGEEAKYAMRIEQDGFNMETEDFQVELFYGMQGKSIVITRSQMTFTIEGYAFFIFDTSEMVGRVTAKCTYWVPDTDCPDGLRTMTDEQLLCFVCTDPLPQFACVPGPSACEHAVTYERSTESDVASNYYYLSTSQGDRLITNDSEYILVLKTADSTNNDD
ncbi:MAG: hypothetical protein II822_10540 [Prevotella sp.]|nr:hypothetical protein [Prevotella sp.]